MLVFRSLSPGQHKLYPAVPKTEAMKKALELSISKAFLAEDGLKTNPVAQYFQCVQSRLFEKGMESYVPSPSIAFL
jgi:hypothetical protein